MRASLIALQLSPCSAYSMHYISLAPRHQDKITQPPHGILLAHKNYTDRYAILHTQYCIITITPHEIYMYHVKQHHFQLCSKNVQIRMLKIPSSGTSLISVHLLTHCSSNAQITRIHSQILLSTLHFQSPSIALP